MEDKETSMVQGDFIEAQQYMLCFKGAFVTDHCTLVSHFLMLKSMRGVFEGCWARPREHILTSFRTVLANLDKNIALSIALPKTPFQNYKEAPLSLPTDDTTATRNVRNIHTCT